MKLSEGWEVAKTLPLEQLCTHTTAHATLIGHRDVQSAIGAILGSHHPPDVHYWSHGSSCDFGWSAKCPPEI